MRFGRIAVLLFCGALMVVNGPVFTYRAITDASMPDGTHSRVGWLAAAAANVAIGALGIWLIFRAHRREQRRPAGQCIHCGYDLRATPERCPECGEIPQPLRGEVR